MKLSTISNGVGPIPPTTAVDLDVASRLGPMLSKHLSSIEALCNLLPNCDEIKSKVSDLRTAIQSSVNLGDNVLETDLSHVSPSVSKLESRLELMAKNGSTLDYGAIDEVMQQICKEDGCAPSDLHVHFKEKNGATPDSWAKKIKEASLDVKISEHHIIEMYETMRPGLGDKAWVAISKRLKAQGSDPALVDQLIDRAIIRSL
jgi:hypothetical protein